MGGGGSNGNEDQALSASTERGSQADRAMPAKKKGGTTDDAAAKMASYMLPVPAPSSMRAWTSAQSVPDEAQLPDLDGYIPVGDLLRDYVFMCKGLGVSPHPCIVKRIRRPMSEASSATLGLWPRQLDARV